MSQRQRDDVVIFCDFDGTITKRDTCDAVLTRFAPPSWREVDERFHRGEIGSHECIQGQFAGVCALEGEIRAFLRETMEVDPDFPRFVSLVEDAGIPLYIISDGFTLHIDEVLGGLGLNHLPRFANELVLSRSGAKVRFPHARPECVSGSGNCKCSHFERLAAGRRAVLIGDGWSDRCAARVADLIFAKRILRAHCEAKGIAHVSFETFADILAGPEFAALLEAAPTPALSEACERD